MGGCDWVWMGGKMVKPIFKGTSLAMNEKKEKSFEKKKNFEILRNNRVLNGF